MNSTTKLNWGILGTGNIAKTFADALLKSETGVLRAVGSRTLESAQNFASEYSDVAFHATYESLLADENVEVIYISLPNHLHCVWTIRCAQAGKHILCEKPFATNSSEAMAMLEAARRYDVFLMEAFMYRCHPQTAKLASLVREGAIGKVRLIESNFSYNMGENLGNIRMQNGASGGGIMDVGCYCVSAARLIAGAANGQDFAEPIELKAVGYIGENSRVDEWATAVLKFPGDVLANLSCGTQVSTDATLKVWGSAGNIQIPNPWFPGNNGSPGKIILNRDGHESEEIEVPSDVPLYAIEADTVARHIANRQAPAPCMSWLDSLGNQKTLDLWREQIGLVFDAELPANLSTPFSGQKLKSNPEIPMMFGRVEGVAKPVSRVVMGTMVMHDKRLPYSFALMDDFYERGGNCFDTAYVYAGGGSERAVGQWLKARDIRDEVVVIAKGAHTPNCTPEGLTQELNESLQRLQLDSADIYMLHRDNLEIPVGEFVECLNEHKNAGRIDSFGGSNWSRERLQEANEYAAQKGLTGFSSSSVNFSLAQWNEPMWPGCYAGSDAESNAWYQKTQMPLFAWSSQASGFFTGRFSRQDRDGALQNPQISEVARVWFNDENFARLERVQELAKQKNVGTTQIALAYVLHQSLNIFALIGPQTIEETRTSLIALGVSLSPEELNWLDLGEA